jgi:hypothetical protein
MGSVSRDRRIIGKVGGWNSVFMVEAAYSFGNLFVQSSENDETSMASWLENRRRGRTDHQFTGRLRRDVDLLGYRGGGHLSVKIQP